MDNTCYTISFLVRHPSFDLTPVCERLERYPFRIWKAGESRETPKGGKLEGNYKDSYCCIRLENITDMPIVEQIQIFCTKINQHKDYFDNLVLSGGVLHISIFWNCDKSFVEEFDLNIIRNLDELHISLIFDIGYHN